MILCPKCGASSAGDLERCRRGPRADCPFELLSGNDAAARLLGIVMLLIGLTVSVAISAVLFTSPPPVTGGLVAALQALLVIGVYTFVYSIGGVFVGIGALATLGRRLDFVDRSGGRFVQAWKLLGRTLSLQVVDLDEPMAIPEPSRTPAVPASVAAMRRVAGDARPADSLTSMASRVKHRAETSKLMVGECVASALGSLTASDTIRLRPAEVRVVWPFLARSPSFHSTAALLEPGPGPSPPGALESTLSELVHDWSSRRGIDYPMATARELLGTFTDGEGDFSQHRILRMVEEEGIGLGLLERRPRLSTRRLLPEPSRAGGVTAQDGVSGWSDALEEVWDVDPDVARRLRAEIDGVISSTPAGRSELDRARRRLLASAGKGLVGGSVVLATLVYLISLLV